MDGDAASRAHSYPLDAGVRGGAFQAKPCRALGGGLVMLLNIGLDAAHGMTNLAIEHVPRHAKLV